MNLRKKKALAARTFGVGENRIEFIKPRLDEIKEAITKQDIRDLHNDGAIIIKPIKGRKKSTRRRGKKGAGNVRKKINLRKRNYVLLTRKLRKHVSETRSKMTDKEVEEIRKKIRNSFFKSKGHLKEHIGEMRKQ